MVKTYRNEDSDQLLKSIVEAMQEKKGADILSMDLKPTNSSVTDYYIICHAASKTQVGAIADFIEEQVRKINGIKPHNVEGAENAEWILMDYFDVVVHVFLEDTRNYFRIEKLWADAVITNYDE